LADVLLLVIRLKLLECAGETKCFVLYSKLTPVYMSLLTTKKTKKTIIVRQTNLFQYIRLILILIPLLILIPILILILIPILQLDKSWIS